MRKQTNVQKITPTPQRKHAFTGTLTLVPMNCPFYFFSRMAGSVMMT